MSENLNRAGIHAVLGAGSLILNDYALNITPIERGYRLAVTRGSEVQTMDVMDGVGIVGIEKTGSTGDEDSYRISFTDGSTFDYTIETNAAKHAAAETARAEAESARVNAEQGRVTAESARVNAEQGRVTAESARASAENNRAEAEEKRVSTENIRNDSESARIKAESARQGAEAARQDAETLRANSEQGRVTAEAGRVESESLRNSAESARVNAETARAGAEAQRQSMFEANEGQRQAAFTAAETGRAAAETARVNAEAGRAEAEAARVEAENARATAEEERAQAFAGYQGEINGLKGDIGELNDTLFSQVYVSGNPILIGNAIRQIVTAETDSPKIYAFGKNIVDINLENVVTSAPSSNSTVRDLSKPAIWVGLNASNYFNNAQVAAYSINGDTISVTNKDLLGYGIAFNLPIVSGQKIAVSYVEQTNAVIRIGYYNNGSYVSSINYNSGNKGRFTVPDNVNQMIVCVEPSNKNSTGVVKGLQIEYSELQTEYEAPLKMIEYNVVDGRASIRLTAGANTIIADGNISFTYKSSKVKDTVSESEVNELIGSKLVDYVRKDDPIDSWYRGKKIVTFGDSITNMNKWQPFMAEYLGCTYTRHGVGGGTVSKTSNPEHQDDCMYMDARINALESDADVILVFGGHNDWSNRVPIGSIPTDNTFALSDDGAVDTFVYAYALMIKKLIERFPSARIITMSCVGGRRQSMQYNQDGHYYINGLSMEDFANAVKMVSSYYGIPCVDLSSLSGISTLNANTYLSDAIHPNDEGGKLIAGRVVRELLRFEPIVYSSTWDDVRLLYDVTNQ